MMYILDENRNLVPCKDSATWAKWVENSENRKVAQDRVGDYFVSTVFLGLDHNFGPVGEPRCFETMVFKGGSSSEKFCNRYCSWDEALAGHEKVMEALSLALNSPDGEAKYE